jgi:hypothetical protein
LSIFASGCTLEAAAFIEQGANLEDEVAVSEAMQA